MTKPHHRLAHKVLSVLANRARPGPNITHPDAWRKAVRNDLRHQHWQTLDAILGDDDQARITALTDLLDQPTVTTGTADDSDAMRRALDAQMAENARHLEEALATPRDPDLAKTRLSEIRSDLGPAHHPDRTTTTTQRITEVEVLRTIIGRLLDGWVVGDNCDPDTPDGEEWAWERCRLAPPGSFVDEREPFEDGVDKVLRSFDPVEQTGSEGAST